jgi:hypothetical protein
MLADVDIDMSDREQLLRLIPHVAASQLVEGSLRKHNTGVYAQPIPRNPILNCANIDHEEAKHRGYFKLDFLNMSVYQLVKDPKHYEQMLSATPTWNRLWEDRTWAEQLVHVGNYVDLLKSMRPDSIPRMAAFISIIRPGKAHLQNRPWQEVFDSVWDGDSSRGFTFKKSHSISYAQLVALHMNLLTDFSNQSN